MQIVIDIPEIDYVLAHIKDYSSIYTDRHIAEAIANGTPLPKGHGRLIDAREYENDIRKHYFDNNTVIRCTEIALDNTPTIIEADRAESEEIEVREEPKAENKKRLTNAEWKDFLSEQFGISRTSAAEMLHGMMRWKGEDNFKKRFNGGEAR